MKKKELSVRKRVFLNYTVIGILFLISAGASLLCLAIDVRLVQRILSLVSTIALFSSCCIMAYIRRAQKEKKDELARIEIYKAYYWTSLLADMVAMCILIPIVIYDLMGGPDENASVSLSTVLSGIDAAIFGFLGFKRLATGIIFSKQEDSDEEDD